MGRAFAQHIAILAGCLLHIATFAHAQIGGAAGARTPAATLHWVRLAGAEDCIRGELLARDVEARLSRAVFAAPHAATILIEGYATRADHGYRANLRMSTNDGAVLGERELVSNRADCRELSETVTVVLAIMIDPDAAANPAPALAPSPAPPAQPVCDDEAANDRRHRLVPFVRGALKLLPEPAAGVGAAYEFELRRWGTLRAEAVGFFSQRRTLDLPRGIGLASAGAMFRVAYGGLAYCPISVGGAFAQVASCLGLEFGVVRSEGFGFVPDADTRVPWFSGSAALRGSIRLFGSLRAYVGLSLLATLQRTWVIEDASGRRPFHDQSWAVGTLDLGIGANFAL